MQRIAMTHVVMPVSLLRDSLLKTNERVEYAHLKIAQLTKSCTNVVIQPNWYAVCVYMRKHTSKTV